MTDYSSKLDNVYGQADLSAKILDALASAGKNLDALTRDDLAPFDELHSGGRHATQALATLAGLQSDMYVLDIGSGVGGPARTLAAEFGCRVLGVDITQEFCIAAEVLTDKVGLSEQVSFQQGDALEMPFDTATFDVVWTQNAIMNIADKARLFGEAQRVLKSGGLLAVKTILAGDGPEVHYPVYWANDPDVSFLSTAEAFQDMLASAGFDELIWEDVTTQSIERSRKAQAATQQEQPLIGIHLIYDNVPQRGANVLRGYEEGSIMDVQAVYRKSQA